VKIQFHDLTKYQATRLFAVSKRHSQQCHIPKLLWK